MRWRDVLREPAPDDAVAAMLRRAALEPAPVPRRRHLRFAVQLLGKQLRLVRVSVWGASVLVMGMGVLIAAQGAAGTVLALVAPIVAAAGIAGVCGRDSGFEYLAATATSPRVVLVARVTLVFGFDLLLALGASAVLAGPPELLALIGAWLGPMALLSSVCLLLSVAVNPTAAVAVGMTLWLTRVLAPGLAADTGWLVPLARAVEALWATTLATGALAVTLLCVAVALAGRGRTVTG